MLISSILNHASEMPHDKICKILLNFHCGNLQKEVKFRLHYSNKNCEMFANVRNGEKHFRLKNLLSWQNILNSRQLQQMQKKNKPIKERSSVEESVVFFLFLLNKWKPCHRAINSRPHNFRNGTGQVISILFSSFL